MHGKVYFFEQEVTVTAPTLTLNDFLDYSNKTAAGSINEAVKLKLMYDYFSTSITNSHVDLINNMLDGLQRDGSNLQSDQDDCTQLTVVQVLKSISDHFQTIGSSSLVIRAVDILEELVVNENAIKQTGAASVFSQQTVDTIFDFVDNSLTSIGVVASGNQTSVKTKLQKCIEYALRGSTIDQLPSNIPINRVGASISVSVNKLNYQGFNSIVTTDLLTPTGENIQVRIPKSALKSKAYSQLIIIWTNDLVYRVLTEYSGAFIKSGMVKVILDETDATLNIAETNLKSIDMNITGLVDPIEIDIPYSDPVDDLNTLG